MFSALHEFLMHDVVLFHIGKVDFTLGQVIAILLGIALLFLVTGLLNRVLVNRVLAGTHLDLSTRYTVAALVRYTLLVIGFMVIMQNAGINLTAFSVLAGAIGVGVGFGLQNIVSNFISGLIVMFERPVRIGDRVELGGVEGDVMRIGARATHLQTAEGSVVIMPNQKFITEPVKNWADHAGRSALVLNVNIDRNADLRAVSDLLRELAGGHPMVQPLPAPEVWLTGVTGNAAFRLVVWVSGDSLVRKRVLHELYLLLTEGLAAHNIALA